MKMLNRYLSIIIIPLIFMMALIGCNINTKVLPAPTASSVLPAIDEPLGIASPDKAKVMETIEITDKTALPEKIAETEKVTKTTKISKATQTSRTEEVTKTAKKAEVGVQVEKGRRYSTKEEVAAYIHMFQQLPPNYITKKEAEKKGWDNSKGNLWKVTNKMSIGGDVFGNREGVLPKKEGRKYYECDINYKGGYRGSERIVYSNDGLVFYTVDHYETFEQLF